MSNKVVCLYGSINKEILESLDAAGIKYVYDEKSIYSVMIGNSEDVEKMAKINSLSLEIIFVIGKGDFVQAEESHVTIKYVSEQDKLVKFLSLYDFAVTKLAEAASIGMEEMIACMAKMPMSEVKSAEKYIERVIAKCEDVKSIVTLFKDAGIISPTREEFKFVERALVARGKELQNLDIIKRVLKMKNLFVYDKSVDIDIGLDLFLARGLNGEYDCFSYLCKQKDLMNLKWNISSMESLNEQMAKYVQLLKKVINGCDKIESLFGLISLFLKALDFYETTGVEQLAYDSFIHHQLFNVHTFIKSQLSKKYNVYLANHLRQINVILKSHPDTDLYSQNVDDSLVELFQEYIVC